MAMDDQRQISDDALAVYIVYDGDGFGAEQLAAMLSTLDNLYSILYHGFFPEAPQPLPVEARLHITYVHTGNSIELLLAEGVSMAWNAASGALQVLSPAGIPAAMAATVFGAAKAVVELRKTWVEIDEKKATIEEKRANTEKTRAEASRIPAEKRRLEAEAEKLQAEAEKLRIEAAKSAVEREKLLIEIESLRRQARAVDAERRDTGDDYDTREPPMDMPDIDSEPLDQEVKYHAAMEGLRLIELADLAPNLSELRINGVAVVSRR
jgi:hypothetical protein